MQLLFIPFDCFAGNIMEEEGSGEGISPKHDEENAISMSAAHDDVEARAQIPDKGSTCEEPVSNEGGVVENVKSAEGEPAASNKDTKTTDDVVPSEISHDSDQKDAGIFGQNKIKIIITHFIYKNVRNPIAPPSPPLPSNDSFTLKDSPTVPTHLTLQ